MSFENLIVEVKKNIIPIIIVGNKIDLRTEVLKHIETLEVQEFVRILGKKYNYEFQYLETSAFSGFNINKAFEDLVDKIFKLPN